MVEGWYTKRAPDGAVQHSCSAQEKKEGRMKELYLIFCKVVGSILINSGRSGVDKTRPKTALRFPNSPFIPFCSNITIVYFRVETIE